ncbi:Hypothetical protein DEACI_3939 [Acididesulfobacillus acetoxydans]|uniref:Uncharacterized protein n=1 Tax=Acididesulfobacillus acetoxydans TaxID=1561005 RepID=A0A8S0XD43_9FIRM|nr:winged helix-turn-helix domain-containing protein [Acididesulfobacillus acetoxydans]CAA7603116.1 Hypothetical protein DEACI_3939 [Acididesulfobacillus acetoxydans]CEJ05646.1 Hypothetical protein DEACI_0020 [Acididesulfobacillus acetoxydans]
MDTESKKRKLREVVRVGQQSNTNDTVESASSSLVMVKESFSEWLFDGHAKKYSPAIYLSCIDKVSAYLIRRKLSLVGLWELTTFELFKSIYDKALNDKQFRATDKKTYATFVQVGQAFLRFLKSKPSLLKASNQSIGINSQVSERLTIRGAVIKILQLSQRGMTVGEIYNKIIENELYSFGAKNPLNVVRIQIESACKGSNYTYRATKDYFRCTVDAKGEKFYYLLDARNVQEPDNKADVYAGKPLVEDFQNELTKIESFIKSADICGAKLDDIVAYVSPTGRGVNPIKAFLDSAKWAVTMPDHLYIHRDCIIDFDEAAEKMFKILKMQFWMFNGYTTDTVFFDALAIELPMFLNDNNLAEPQKVYYLARHIFSVEKYAGNNLVFYGNKHIWETESVMPKNIRGVLMSFIQSCGGKATRDECANYLDKLKIASGNINGLLRVENNRDVLQYRPGEYLLCEVLDIDDHWLGQVKACLNLVLEDRPYIILRGLNTHWFNRLPTLPLGLNWELLLLQEVIQKFIPEYRTIQALDGQSLDTIKAGIVPQDSVINAFADLVYAYLVVENLLPFPKPLAAEELRELLKRIGMIEGNELISNMHKALKDRRFAWASDNNSVKILGK